MLNMRLLLLHPYLIVPSMKKHDCNYVIINSINFSCANNMQNPQFGDDDFFITATYCNDHDWGDNDSYDLENLFKSHDEYACNNIKSGLEECQL